MTGIADKAREASEESQGLQREQAQQRRQDSRDKLCVEWAEMWSRKLRDVEAPEIPASFEWGSSRIYSGRTTDVGGWRFQVDGVPFMYVTTYGHEGIHVLLTCPDCGAEQADSFYGLKNLGDLLRRQRQIGHNCWQAESRMLAVEIASAARMSRLPVNEILEKALDHYDILNRG